MYKVGTFSSFEERVQPGVYSRLHHGAGTRVSTVTYGGVALPWPSYKSVSEPEPIEARQNNVSTIANEYRLADVNTFGAIGANILKSANTVYICPYNRRVRQELEVTADTRSPSEGWSDDGNVHITAVFSNPSKSIARWQPLVVTIEPTDGQYKVNVQFPWQNTTWKATKTLNKKDMADGKEGKIEVEPGDVAEDGQKLLTALYGDKQLSLTITIKTELKTTTHVMVGGGHAIYDAAATTINDLIAKKLPKLPPGALIAFDAQIDGGLKDVLDGPVMYITGFTAPAGANCFAVAELKDGYATLTMYVHDVNTGTTTANVIERKQYKPNNTGTASDATIDKILESLDMIGSVSTKKEPKASSWALPLAKGASVRVGFASFHALATDGLSDEMDDFMSTAGKTGAGLVFYVPPRDMFGDDLEKHKEQYQKIQKTYLDKTGSLCPATQLVMDETWLTNAQFWDDKRGPLTISSPFCISLAGDARGGLVSLKNSAYMAGIMARCGETRTATASRYPGKVDELQIYSQPIIEHMHDVGVMTWHSHVGEKMIYIDASSYRTDRKTSEDVVYPAAFERNKAVRAANKFRYDAANMFIANYFEKNWYGDNAEVSIKNDLLMLIRELADRGVFQYPQPTDVTVRNVTTRAYSADVRLNLIESPEVLYITLEV